MPGTVGGHIGWLPVAATGFSDQMGHFTFPWIAIGLAGWGLATLTRRRPWSAALIALIIGTAAAAALAYQYPLAHRLALCLLPIAILLVCAGLDDGSPYPRRRLAAAWGRCAVTVCSLGLVLITAAGVVTGLGKVFQPAETTAARQAIEFVSDHQQPGDLVLVETGGATAVAFYGPRLGVHADGAFSFGRPTATDTCAGPVPVTGAERVWLPFGHHFSNQPANRTEIYLSQLAPIGSQGPSFTSAGDAGAYLINLAEPPAVSVPPKGSWVDGGCFQVHRIRG